MTSNSISATESLNTKLGSLTTTNLGQRTEIAFEQMKAWRDPTDQM